MQKRPIVSLTRHLANMLDRVNVTQEYVPLPKKVLRIRVLM